MLSNAFCHFGDFRVRRFLFSYGPVRMEFLKVQFQIIAPENMKQSNGAWNNWQEH